MWLQLTLSMWLGGYEDEFTFGQHYKLIFPIAHIQTHVPTILKGASFIWPPPDCGAIRISSVALDQDSCKFKALYFKIHGNVGAAGSLQLKCPVLWVLCDITSANSCPSSLCHRMWLVAASWLAVDVPKWKDVRQLTRQNLSTVSRPICCWHSNKKELPVYSETRIILWSISNMGSHLQAHWLNSKSLQISSWFFF